MTRLLYISSLLALLLLSPAMAGNYSDEIFRARKIHVEKKGLQIKQIELGSVGLGKNDFSVEVTNTRKTPASFTLQWITNAGLSQGENRQELDFILNPGEKRKLQGEYTFTALSPFAKIFVSIFEEEINNEPIFRERFHIGVENPGLCYDLSKFENVSGRHLNVYFLPDSVAAKNSKQILIEREAGLGKIENLIGTRFDGTITLFLYPDMNTKSVETLHTGAGWAFDRILVEVYNNEIHLDPFHEMTHIISSNLGSPPPLFDEGLAVYVSETLGSDALEYIVGPGKKIDGIMQQHKRNGKLVSLAELIKVTNIGDTSERSEIEYPESASFVKYLIKNFGSGTFRKIFSTLKIEEDPRKNIQSLEEITGKSLTEIEAHWLSEM